MDHYTIARRILHYVWILSAFDERCASRNLIAAIGFLWPALSAGQTGREPVPAIHEQRR
jgi:hypothetical protein